MAAPLPRFERLPSPTVQLLHEVPDGSSHIDWMIAGEPSGGGVLLTFRLPRRLDSLMVDEKVDAEHIGDHRSAYLDYEGPLSRNRGTVRRLCSGELLHAHEHDAHALRMDVRWNLAAHSVVHQRLKLDRRESQQWLITCLSIHETPASLAAAITMEEP